MCLLLYAIMRLRIILQALNEGHEFSLTEGDVWYPWVRFYEAVSYTHLKDLLLLCNKLRNTFFHFPRK